MDACGNPSVVHELPQFSPRAGVYSGREGCGGSTPRLGVMIAAQGIPEYAWFDVREQDDPDGALRVLLIGEIDMAGAHAMTARLRQLRPQRRVRLDLSQLTFVDCCGLRAVLVGVAAARREGCNFEVDRRVSGAVSRMVDFAGAAAVLWPADAPTVGR